jgi:hypothetical protein
MDIYDVTYLRNVNRCKHEILYTLPPKGGLSGILILKLQLEAFLR